MFGKADSTQEGARSSRTAPCCEARSFDAANAIFPGLMQALPNPPAVAAPRYDMQPEVIVTGRHLTNQESPWLDSAKVEAKQAQLEIEKQQRILNPDQLHMPGSPGSPGSPPPRVPVLTVAIMTLFMSLASSLGVIPFFFVGKLSKPWAGFANALACGVMLAASFGLLEVSVTAAAAAAVCAGFSSKCLKFLYL